MASDKRQIKQERRWERERRTTRKNNKFLNNRGQIGLRDVPGLVPGSWEKRRIKHSIHSLIQQASCWRCCPFSSSFVHSFASDHHQTDHHHHHLNVNELRRKKQKQKNNRPPVVAAAQTFRLCGRCITHWRDANREKEEEESTQRSVDDAICLHIRQFVLNENVVIQQTPKKRVAVLTFFLSPFFIFGSPDSRSKNLHCKTRPATFCVTPCCQVFLEPVALYKTFKQ